jgi:hypothetical protein
VQGDAAGAGGEDGATVGLRKLLLLRPAATIAVVFAVSRALYAAAGVQFDASPLEFAWQLVDPALLERDLLASVWFSHTQPPLFNLFVGVVLVCSPFGDAGTFHIIYLAMGLGIAVLTRSLLVRLGVPPGWSLALAAVFVASPTTVLFESYLFYTYPLTLLLLGLMVGVHRYVGAPSSKGFAVVVGLAAAIVMTRSIFHPAWFVAVAAGLVLSAPRAMRRRLVVVAAVPLLVIVGWMVRAQVLFGTSQLSSWSPMNMARTVTLQLPLDERQQLVRDGTLSPLALEQAFQRYADYEEVVAPCERERPDVAVLTGALKSTGYPNFNDECFLAVYDAYARDLAPALRAEPTAFLRTGVTAAQLHLQPSSLYGQVAQNRQQVDEVDRIVRRTLLLEVTVPFVSPPEPYAGVLRLSGSPLEVRMSLTVLLAELAAIAVGVRSLMRLRRGDRSAATVTLVALCLTVLWVLVVGNAFELQENHRFRFMIDPLLLAGAAAFVARVRRGRRPEDRTIDLVS